MSPMQMGGPFAGVQPGGLAKIGPKHPERDSGQRGRPHEAFYGPARPHQSALVAKITGSACPFEWPQEQLATGLLWLASRSRFFGSVVAPHRVQ